MELSSIIHNISRDRNYIIKSVPIWDGLSDYVSPATDIHINNGLISGLSSADSPVEEATLIDAEGLVIMPALIDSHVHLALDGVDFNAATDRWYQTEALNRHLDTSLKAYVTNGILTLRDGGDKALVGLRAASHDNPGDELGSYNDLRPLIVASGKAIGRKGKYGSFLGDGVNDLNDARLQIENLSDTGVGQIKVLVSGIVSFSDYGKVGSLQFSDFELTQIVMMAHDHGLRVMAHASSDEAVRQCALAGVDSVEHGYFISQDSLRALAEAQIAWTPTVVPVANQVLKDYLREGYSPSQVKVIERTYREHQEKLVLANDLGVPLLLGTDAGAIGVLHGTSLAEEISLFAEGGLPMATILRSATSTAAKALGLDKLLGTITPGKLPALIGVEGNPLSEADFASRIRLICLPDFHLLSTCCPRASSSNSSAR